MNLEKKSIVGLKQEIEDSRPRLEGATSWKPCEICDIYSLQEIGIIPGQGCREHVYECIICGYTDSHT